MPAGNLLLGRIAGLQSVARIGSADMRTGRAADPFGIDLAKSEVVLRLTVRVRVQKFRRTWAEQMPIQIATNHPFGKPVGVQPLRRSCLRPLGR